jgi:hypothetical protein
LPLCFELVIVFQRGLEFGLESVCLIFVVVELEISVFKLFPEVLVFEFKFINFILQERVVVLEVGEFVGLDGEGVVEGVDLLPEVEDVEVGLGVVLVERGDLLLLFLDEFFVGEGLVLEVGLGLLEFFLGEVEVLFQIEFLLGDLVVLMIFVLERFIELAFFLFQCEFIVEERLRVRNCLSEFLFNPLHPIPRMQQLPIQRQRLLSRLLQLISKFLVLQPLPLHSPLQLLHLGISILLSLSQVADLLLVVHRHLAIVPLLSLELGLEIVNPLVGVHLLCA